MSLFHHLRLILSLNWLQCILGLPSPHALGYFRRYFRRQHVSGFHFGMTFASGSAELLSLCRCSNVDASELNIFGLLIPMWWLLS